MLRHLVPLLLASVVVAQDYYSAALDGAQEVPPVVTAGHGWAVVRHDTTTATVRIFVFHETLSGAPTAAHLHLGAAGINGPVVVPLVATGPNTFTGAGGLTPAQATALAANGTYLNVHTAANPAGEIRGQVVPSASTRFTGVLSGAQEVPANASAATGTVVAYLHEPENRLVYIVNTMGLGNVTAAHIHDAPAGANGPVVVPLNGAAGNYCGVTGRLTAAQRATLLANGFYVNVHTAMFPAGEIRAQLLADAGDHFVARIDAAQQVPPNPSPGLGRASLIRTPGGTLVLSGAFAGLSGPPTAAHVHLGPVGVNGGIVFPLVIAGSTLSATYTPSAADLVNLRAGNWYVNIHTAAFGGGEIRGQLGPANLPTTFGEGCPGSNGVRPQIGASGFPSIGSSMRIDLYGALPGSVALMAFGGSRDTVGPIPLPVELTTLGINSPRCFLLVDPVNLVTAFLDPFGCGNLTLNVPFQPVLRGSQHYAQWFALDFLANPGGFVASSALTLRIQ